jgi:hypothetical protein
MSTGVVRTGSNEQVKLAEEATTLAWDERDVLAQTMETSGTKYVTKNSSEEVSANVKKNLAK